MLEAGQIEVASEKLNTITLKMLVNIYFVRNIKFLLGV